MQRPLLSFLVVLALANAGPAPGQVLGGGPPGGLPALPAAGDALRGLTGEARTVTRDSVLRPVREAVEAARPTRVVGRDLLRRNPRVLEADDAGRPVVRGEVTALGMSEAVLAAARSAGFTLKSRERITGLDLEAIVLVPPKGDSAREAVKRLRTLDPDGQYDFNHIYFASGASAAPTAVDSGSAGSGRGLRIGLVDGSVEPAAAGARVVQRAFGPGGAKVSAHATAVASLIAGEGADFRGAVPGATVYVADVYGPTPAGGSAMTITRGLGWLAEQGIPVINVSLVGPPNALLAAAVHSLTRRGHILVAAVGNDGPAAPPLYPAAYPEVVGVTGLDPRRRVLPEAARGPQVDFAAPGAGLAAAGPRGGYVAVRGTSYAAPLVAGLAAQLTPEAAPGAVARTVAALARRATDLGAAGPDAIFGKGGLALELATPPAALARARR